MFPSDKEFQGCENDGATLAGLVFAAAEDEYNAARTAGRRWRRGVTVLRFIHISIKKTTQYYQEEDQLESSTSTVPLINHQIQLDSTQQEEDEDTQEAQNEEQLQQLRTEVLQIVKERDRTSLDSLGGVQKVASIFGSHLETGIQEPEVRSSYRDNPIHTKYFVVFLFEACNDYTIFLLLVSAGLSFGTGIIEEGRRYGWHDGVVILAAVSMLITCPSLASFRRARKLEKERNKMKVRVVRREEQDITISNLVEGDIVRLQKGDLVPADGLLVSGGLVLDGVLNSKIDGEKNPFLFFGSKVKEGCGSMLATSVGAKTELGELLSSVNPFEKTLLEAQIENTNTFVENLGLSVSVLIAFVAFIRLLCSRRHGVDNEFPELKGNISVDMLMKMFEKILLKPQGKVSILASALTVVVIAIQHGMPFVITISLSCWNSKVVKNLAEPQNLSACATMGIVTVICIDATGGVACNDLEVSQFWIGGKDLKNDMDSEINPAVTKPLEQVMLGISESFLEPAISASPLFVSLVSWATSRWGMNKECVGQNLPILKYRKSSTDKRCCGILMKNDGDIMNVYWSGAALTILNRCSHYYDSDGRSYAIDEDMKNRFELVIKAMEGSGLRPMAFACRQTEVEEIQEDGLYLLALAGLKYPCTEEIKKTVKALRNAGVCIRLVSEDDFSALRSVACELGFTSPELDELVLEREQIQDLQLPERMEKMNQMTVMGSIFAEDKLLYVQSLQQKDHVVAFFGGSSISNIPALKKADIGITEDTPRTMASESSDIIIKANGSLSTSLKFGRCVYHNITRFHQLQLTVCISGLLITLVTTMSSEETSITALQLIWVNWITCILGGLMMAMELQTEELISIRPAKRTQSLLTKVMWKNIALEVVSQASVMLIFQFKGQVIPGMNKDIQKATIFSSFTLSQVFNLFHLMKLAKKEVLLSVVRNKWFLLGSVSVMVMQVVVAEYLKILGDCVKLNWVQWVVCFLLAALPCGIHVALEFIAHSLLSSCNGLPTVHSRTPTRPYLLRIAIPFSVFVFFFGISYHNSFSGRLFAKVPVGV